MGMRGSESILRTLVSSRGIPSGPIVRTVRVSCKEPSSRVTIETDVEVDVNPSLGESINPTMPPDGLVRSMMDPS